MTRGDYMWDFGMLRYVYSGPSGSTVEDDFEIWATWASLSVETHNGPFDCLVRIRHKIVCFSLTHNIAYHCPLQMSRLS